MPGLRQMSLNASASAAPLSLQATEEPRDRPRALGDDEPTRLAKGCGDAYFALDSGTLDIGALALRHPCVEALLSDVGRP